jgi:predicted  nucleic acid-binding Zn-ribbon protein
MLEWQPFVQLGVGGILLLILWLIVDRGALRTKFEADAWKDRTKRAEDQVDRLIPAVEKLTDTVDKLVETNKTTVAAIQKFMDRVESVQFQVHERRAEPRHHPEPRG